MIIFIKQKLLLFNLLSFICLVQTLPTLPCGFFLLEELKIGEQIISKLKTESLAFCYAISSSTDKKSYDF